MRIQVQGAYAWGKERCPSSSSTCDVADINAASWGARFDKRIHQMPIYGYLKYGGTWVDNKDASPASVTDHTVTVGLNFLFGTKSLIDNDRRGVTFDLPDVGRWTGYSLDVVD